MPRVYPYQQITASLTGGNLVAKLPGVIYRRKLTRLTIVGPTGSRFELYANAVTPNNLVDSTQRGQRNTADYSNPIPIEPGVELYAVWPLVTGAATATFHLQEG